MILITGVAGYIGSHIIFKLIKENEKGATSEEAQ